MRVHREEETRTKFYDVGALGMTNSEAADANHYMWINVPMPAERTPPAALRA